MKRSNLLATQTVQLRNSDARIRYAELGDQSNPTVILLHGVPENLQAWYAFAPLLAIDYHVLAIDWPGFGGSDPFAVSEDYTSRKFADVIVDFMDTLQIDRANLVGTDIGLLPALLVGLQHPNRVSKIAVMDGMPFPRSQYSSWELKSFAKKGSILGKALVRWFPAISAQIAYLKGFYRGHSIPADVRREFAADGTNPDTQDAFLSYFQNFRENQEYFESRAHEVDVPVLVAWGKYDRFISSKLGGEIAERLANATFELIDKSGHYVHMDKPTQLARVVKTFLDADSDSRDSTNPAISLEPEPVQISKPKLISVIDSAMFVRAMIVAIVLGSILTLVNQSGWVNGNEPLHLSQLILVFLLPFGVVATAQIAGAYQAAIDSSGQHNPRVGESLFATVISHGIPARAIVIALAFGGINAVVAISELLWFSGSVASLPIVPLAQAFVLPLVFGLLSQTVSYRRSRFQAART